MYDERNYLIFDVSELDEIDFSQVLETSKETVRKSINGAKTFVKWAGERPDCTKSLSTAQGPFTHEEILAILSSPEWIAPLETT